MEAAATELKEAMEKQQAEVRAMVLFGVEQVEEGQTKDINEVCDRLEKKYAHAAIQN